MIELSFFELRFRFALLRISSGAQGSHRWRKCRPQVNLSSRHLAQTETGTETKTEFETQVEAAKVETCSQHSSELKLRILRLVDFSNGKIEANIGANLTLVELTHDLDD